MKKNFFLALILFTLAFSLNQAFSQRRARPGSLKHTDKDVENVYKEVPVTCTYIKNGATFRGEIYYLSSTSSAKMKMGDATLTIKNGKYRLKFNASKYQTRDALPPGQKHKYNPWRDEKVANDFVAEGKFTTYKRNGKIYVRMEDDDGGILFKDCELESINAKAFGGIDDDILYAFELK